VSNREHESLCAGCRQLYFLSSDPYDFGRLTGKRVNAFTAVWSPNGRWIVLARGLGPAGTIGLLVMRPDSSGAHALVAEAPTRAGRATAGSSCSRGAARSFEYGRTGRSGAG
jgi:hypothetical protein